MTDLTPLFTDLLHKQDESISLSRPLTTQTADEFLKEAYRIVCAAPANKSSLRLTTPIEHPYLLPPFAPAQNPPIILKHFNARIRQIYTSQLPLDLHHQRQRHNPLPRRTRRSHLLNLLPPPHTLLLNLKPLLRGVPPPRNTLDPSRQEIQSQALARLESSFPMGIRLIRVSRKRRCRKETGANH